MSERLENFPETQNFHAFGNALCYNGHEPCFERRGAMYIKLTLQEKLKDEPHDACGTGKSNGHSKSHAGKI